MSSRSAISVTAVTECLRELADETFQRRVWLAANGPEVSSFEEAICGLFDDTGLAHALDRGQDVFGREADNLLWLIRRQAGKIDCRLAPEQLLDSPKLRGIRDLATQALLVLDRSTLT